jgi:cytolysin (calcineurin-like family phosphatase)
MRRLALTGLVMLAVAGCGRNGASSAVGLPAADGAAAAPPDLAAVPDQTGVDAGAAPLADATAPVSGMDATPDAPVAAPRGTDVTFLAFGDPQYGGGPGDKNSFHIQALNEAPALVWPAIAGLAGAGRPVGEPAGVIIAGDLTQNGQAGRSPIDEWYTGDPYAFDLDKEYGLDVANPRVSAELGLFLRDYGLAGGDGLNPFKLRWRVFEGYGNHDFDVLERHALAYGNQAPAVDVVSLRNRVRAKWPELRRIAPGSHGHYSWDWGDLHLVHLNLAAADGPSADGAQQPRDPRQALAFLADDLTAEVGSSCRPVIIITHYGFDPFSAEARWWDMVQREALFAALRPYNVIALLHGHVHETRAYRTSDATGKSYDVFSLGSPYYAGQPTNGGRGHFAIFHVTDDHLDAADVSWLPANPVPEMADGRDLWTGKRLADLAFQPTTTFADGWGGWVVSKKIDRAGCRAAVPP